MQQGETNPPLRFKNLQPPRAFMKYLCFVIALCVPASAMGKWSVPAKPDPQVILHEARADARAHRFEDALAKQLWFHQHALEIRPSLAGVRGVALMDWHDLGKVYPPALE